MTSCPLLPNLGCAFALVVAAVPLALDVRLLPLPLVELPVRDVVLVENPVVDAVEPDGDTVADAALPEAAAVAVEPPSVLTAVSEVARTVMPFDVDT